MFLLVLRYVEFFENNATAQTLDSLSAYVSSAVGAVFWFHRRSKVWSLELETIEKTKKYLKLKCQKQKGHQVPTCR